MQGRTLSLVVFVSVALMLGLHPVVASETQKLETSPAVVAGGLSCFSIIVPNYNPAAPPVPPCDALCAEHHAACTGFTGLISGAGLSCASTPAQSETCRCCAVAH